MKKRARRHPHPEFVTLQMEDVELQEDDAGWSFEAYCQLFSPVVNDRFMRFFPGSFLKSFRERIPTGSIKVHDGHNWGMTATGTLGRVIAGREDEKGALVTLFISRAHEDIATKVDDGTLTELSCELFRMKEDRDAVAEIDAVPEHARPWAELTPEGKVKVFDVYEVRLDAVGIVSASSQGRNVRVSPPTVITFQDLPVAKANFDAAAAADRLRAWAGCDLSRRTSAGEPMPNYCRLSAGYLVGVGGDLLGQIADVIDGELVVCAEALDTAYDRLVAELDGRLEGVALTSTLAAAARQIGAYEERLRSGGLTTATDESMLDTKDTAPTGAEPPTGTHSDDGSERATGLVGLERRIQLTELRHRMARSQGVRDEPVGTSQANQRGGDAGLRGDPG